MGIGPHEVTMRYNRHFENHFGSCVLLAKTHDPYRDRDVQLRLIPGEFDVVGVTDGTDAWVAPVSGDPFSLGISRIIESVRAGTFKAAVKPSTTRHALPKAVVEQVKGLVLRRR